MTAENRKEKRKFSVFFSFSHSFSSSCDAIKDHKLDCYWGFFIILFISFYMLRLNKIKSTLQAICIWRIEVARKGRDWHSADHKSFKWKCVSLRNYYQLMQDAVDDWYFDVQQQKAKNEDEAVFDAIKRFPWSGRNRFIKDISEKLFVRKTTWNRDVAYLR